MDPFDLIIFDCDGVLADSERLAVRTEAEILAELGWPLSEADIVTRFVGRSAHYMHETLEAHLGRTVDWDLVFETRYHDIFAKELVEVPGVSELLSRVAVQTCVASSGSHAGIRYKLQLTGLLPHFEGHIFSAEDVEQSKPAPDIFLHAARVMGVDPQRCAVVEDSVAGVLAGVSAGMVVFGFSGSVTPARDLRSAGARVFDRMSDLAALIARE
ncbi:MAG TPA: HAD family hydrolase [Acidimicrobiales bacterium]|nr:HAD family hydrolase [Acidimicrobiales bacterium]